MKLLVVCQAMDLSRNLGITPACWQLMKGLTEIGHDVTAVPYFGASVQTLWWESLDNPCSLQQTIYDSMQALAVRTRLSRDETSFRNNNQKRLARLIDVFVTPHWEKFLGNWFSKNKLVDAVIFFTLPPFLLMRLTKLIHSQGVPVVLYDGDASATALYEGISFNYYEGADLSSFDCIISNSKGALQRLREMGAPKAETVYWGIDPSAFPPLDFAKTIDVFFFGFGAKYREDWIRALLAEPSKTMAPFKFAAGGASLGLDLGNTRFLGKVPYRHYTNLSKINLNIARRSHSDVYASSTSRLFELASMRSTIVSNPCLGIEEWFQPEKEVFVAHDSKEASELYKWLLSDDELRAIVGERARKRLISEHTHIHRAREITRIIEGLS